MPGCYRSPSCPDSISSAQNPPRFRPKALVLSLACLAAPGVWAAEAPARLDTVHVTADGPQARVGSNKLDREEIERPQARSLAEVLDALPGVNAGGSQRPGGQTINVWGFESVEHVQVSLDGAPQGFDKYQQGTSFIDPELLGSVEVMKGGHSPFYGNGAFGAVVKAETKTVAELLQPGKSVGGFAKLMYQDNGNQFGQSLAAYAGGPGSKADILAYVTRSRAGDGKKGDGSSTMFSGNDLEGGMLKLAWRPAPGHRLRLGWVSQEEERRTPWAAKRGDIPAPSAADIKKYGWEGAWLRQSVWREQQNETVSADWTFVSDSPWLDLQLSYAQSRRYQHDTRPPTASIYAFSSLFGNESWVTQRDRRLELRNTARFGSGWARQEVTMGVSWAHKTLDALFYRPDKVKDPAYNYGYLNPRYQPPGEETVRSAYWVHQWQPLDSLTLTPSLRYDHVWIQGRENLASAYNDPAKGHDYSGLAYSGWSPRLGARWNFRPGWTLDAGYTRTWRAPSVDEMYDTQTLGSTTASSRQLRPETLNAVKLGLEYERGSVLTSGDNLSAALTWYRQTVKNDIAQRLGPNRGDAPGAPLPPVIGFYRNMPGYVIQGFELEGRYQAGGWFGSLSLSSTKGDRNHSLLDPWGKDEPITNIPPRKAVANLGYRWNKIGLSLSGQGKFVRKQDRVLVDSPYAYPAQHGYSLFGLSLGWQPKGSLKGFEARLAVDNLFNVQYEPYLTEGAEGMGRAIRTSVSWRF